MDTFKKDENYTMNVFQNGMTWLRADFHLHTNADKEFAYNGNLDYYYSNYIQRLVEEKIQVGVITNHNKFDIEEYKALKKTAKRENIWLISGVELSVNDGANGIHCLITFDNTTWLMGNENYIEQFLTSAFEGVPNRENKNTRCKYNLETLLKKLDEHRNQGRDSFLVLAHVEQSSGFFNELDGGRIQQIAKDELFKSTVLGLQKMRTYNNIEKYYQWFGGALPAFVEGSDSKCMVEVGKASEQNGQEMKTYIKIGEFNFEALKYALIDKEHRISSKIPISSNAHIKSIQFEGGKLDMEIIDFSPDLNTLIGIRGSGKSSIIEILRYALGIQLTGSSADANYKNDLISHVLGSGGKVIVNVFNRQDKKVYKIEKIFGQKENIYDATTGEHIECSISALLDTPVYFGQKDLSNKKEGFEADLLKGLIGNRLEMKLKDIDSKKREIRSIISEIQSNRDLTGLKDKTETEIKDAEQKIQYFKEQGLEEKLKLQTQFNQDIDTLTRNRDNIMELVNDIDYMVDKYEQSFTIPLISCEINKTIFDEANAALQDIKNELDNIKRSRNKCNAALQKIENVIKTVNAKSEDMSEEFAKIKREINSDTLNPDMFLSLTRIISTSKIKIEEINKQIAKQKNQKDNLSSKFGELNELWLQEFNILKDETNKINNANSNLSISIEFKKQKESFKSKLKDTFRGTGIRETTYDTIVNEFADFIEIYRNESKTEQIVGTNMFGTFMNRFKENAADLLTFRVKDKVVINYKGKELDKHSLGQRASALILFLLAQKDNDILIIDQPEDDLDNQTIYDEVIKEILKLKGQMQFIFATHNANIPVLGDSDKIIACSYDNESKIKLQTGTIDTRSIQKTIVNIMEGGEDAFNKRRNIYSIWRS